MSFVAVLAPVQGCASVAVPSPTNATSCLRGEYRALPADGDPVTTEALAAIRKIIENRLNQYGVSQLTVQTQGTDGIVVQFSEVSDEPVVRALISSTARIDFVGVPPARDDDVVDGQPIPVGLRVLFSGDQIETAAAAATQGGGRSVDFVLKDQGAQLFAQYTRDHTGERFAIVRDGIVISAPVIRAPIDDGRGQISGGFSSQAEVDQLVALLTFGALPNPIEEVSFERC